MGEIVFVLGKSGTGKTTSLRNFEEGEVGVFSVAEKALPFKKYLPTIDGDDYGLIERTIKRNALKRYVVDDAGYLMQFENLDKADQGGYDKFTKMAVHFSHLVRTAKRETTRDTVVYFLMHPTVDEDDGHYKPKTVGRFLDEKLCLEGLVDEVLVTEVDSQGRYWFITNAEHGAKTPLDMFDEQRIPNDLKAFDTTLREYRAEQWERASEADKKKSAE